jgi:glutathione reductase (NADPH)
VYRGSQILGGFDREAVAFLTEEMRKKGINIILETDVIEVRSEGQKKKVAKQCIHHPE